jgi:alkanesulfonate monooxygenase SsuD/methylene tetrahydromethanopterin reductase-like flavin-dependent oxidoreductase (luciferase family)
MQDKLKTPKPVMLPAILVVGGSEPFVERCRRSAIPHRAFVKHADVSASATEAARSRPRVLLMAHHVYAADPDEFDALARDVCAHLVRVESEDVDDAELEAAISDGLAAGDRLRRDAAGRQPT